MTESELTEKRIKVVDTQTLKIYQMEQIVNYFMEKDEERKSEIEFLKTVISRFFDFFQ